MRFTFATAKKLLLAIIICAGSTMLLGGGKVSANHLGPGAYSPNPGPLPGNISSYLSTSCGHSGLSPAFVQWLSAAGSPATTTINVAYGAPSIQLDLHFAGVVCIANSGGTNETRLWVRNASANPPATVSGLVGDVLQLAWTGTSYQTPGNYRHTLSRFTYAPAGGFTTSGLYRITLDDRVISHFASGSYKCAADGSIDPGGWNYARCPTDSPTFGVFVNVAPPNFNLNPAINVSVNGTAGTSAQVGDTVQFRYVVSNTGTTRSDNTACSIYRNTYTGYHAASPSPVPGGLAGPNPGCPRDFAVGSTTVATETFVVAAGNQTHCRSLFVNPATYGGGQRGKEVCVIVANQPYLKVFGGDISAGNGLETAPSTCTNNTNAAVVSWNKRAAGSYAGAGAQYAAYALSTITDFSSAQNLSGGATEPAGLSFANTATNVAAGNFGGSWGTASCIPDYYSRMPASTLSLPSNVSSMVTGAYFSNVGTTLVGGNVNPGNKVSVYVNGDVFISSDIVYPGTWSVNNMPLFQLVVRGNIYISSNVHRLDGVYIAQKNGATGGTIYTCATSATPLVLTNGASYNTCNSKLVINGAFVANSIQFLRTASTLSQSNATETSNAVGAGTSGAEVFNFNPTLWMVQPLDTSGTVDNYDAITSLPPVL